MKKKNVFFLLIFLLGSSVIFSNNSTAAEVLLPDEAQICLGCHSDKGLTKQLESKEVLHLYINSSEFARSVHAPLGCNSCHTDISMESHPQVMKIKGKKEWALKASQSCRMCHTDEQIYKKPIHRYVITKAKAPTCAECHGLHAIKRISEWKPVVKDTQYCLTCHKHQLSISIAGEVMSLRIDESLLRGSVHNKHRCQDCHSEFSKEQHPVRTFASIREHSISVSEVCKRCHSDKSALVDSSIHFVMLKKGSLNAPVCTDCHGFHTVVPKAVYKTMLGVPCKKCHEDIFNAYKESVHGRAKIKGVEKAPICSSCHQAHDVKVTSLTGQMKSVCLGCHKEAIGAHKKWLTNTELHLDMIGCAACHSPEIEREIYLYLYDLNTEKPFYEEQVLQLLNTDREGLKTEIDPDRNSIDAFELGRMVKRFEQKGVKVAFRGRMDVRKGIEPHQLALKTEAVRDCAKCHHAESDFFKYVSVAIIATGGKPVIFEAKQDTLTSLVSLFPLSQFYVLGSTRIWLLDILLILAVLGGASFPVGHIMLRILTSPIREARRLKALKKEGK